MWPRIRRSSVTVSEGGLAERVTAKSVTGSYFPLMGQRAAIGRLFDPSDDTRGDRVAVLTAARTGPAASAAIHPCSGGPSSSTARAIPSSACCENSDGPLERNVAVFTAARWPPPTRKGPFFTNVLGRLRPGVSQAAAAETLHATNARLFPIWKSSYQDEKATWGLLELKTRVVGDIGATLFVALAAVGCVLLIACANAINLLVARALARSRELAIRSALGASRGRLLQHLVAESAVLCAGAAATGAAVAWLGLRLVASYGTDYIPRVDEIGMSASMFGWLAGLDRRQRRVDLCRRSLPGDSRLLDPRRARPAVGESILQRRTGLAPLPARARGGGVRAGHAARGRRRAGHWRASTV